MCTSGPNQPEPPADQGSDHTARPIESTELGHTYQELVESRRMLLTLLSNLPGMVYRCANDPDWTMRFVSEGCTQLTGYQPADLIGNRRVSFNDIIHPEDRAPIWEQVQNNIKTNRSFQFTYRIITADGREKWVWEQGRGVFSDDGQLEALEGFIADITEIQQTEEALRKERNFNRTLVQTSPIFFVAINADGKILMVNEVFLQALGYRLEEVVGQDYLTTFVPPDDRLELAPIFTKLVMTNEPTRNENRVLAKDGRQLLVEWHGRQIFRKNGEFDFFFGVGINITERRKAEEEHARLEAQLYQIQKLEAIGQLAGGVAHDFNNLLAVIMGNASILKRDPSLQPKARDAAHDIMNAAERGSALTQQLLAYARGGIQEPTATDLNRLIRSVAPMLQRTVPPRVHFELSLADNLPAVLADPPRIEQIVINLSLNAIQAMNVPGTITLSTREETLDESTAAALQIKEGRYIRLDVADQGCGIDPRNQAHIFEPFFSTKEMGRGMGLSVTHGIIQSHRGQIRVESTVSKGTIVTVWLPVTDQPEAAVRPFSATPKPPQPPRGNETILVIDDEKTLAATIEQMLSSLGYCVVSHTDADQALAFLDTNAEDVNLVLCDLTMHKHTGRQIAEMIARQYPHIIVLLTSGYDAATLSEEIKGAPVAGCVKKPFSLALLAQTVRNALDHLPIPPPIDNP